MKTTKQIEEEYNISCQTTDNLVKEGWLESSKKDFHNWFDRRKEDKTKLKKNIQNKKYKNNLNSSTHKETLKISNRRYLGSKQKMLSFIQEVVEQHCEKVNTVADVFAGTGVVANLFRKQGKKVIVNDILHSNLISYYTWFGNEDVDMELIKKCVDELNNLTVKSGNYVSINFGDKYFSMDNAKKIGAIREKIETYELNNREKSFLLTSLLYAMDKVANTVGHYDAYRKKMDSFQPIHLRVPEYNHNKDNEIYNKDANLLVREIKADLVYIDTPYNSRQYGDAYHLLENIIDWKKPEVKGVAKKMIDRMQLKSDYSTQKAPITFDDLIQHINAKYILVSYNNMANKGNGRSNAKISNEEILQSLRKKGKVEVFDTPFKAFTTGKSDIKNHHELLYLCKIIPKKETKKTYIQSAINYTGGKYKLLPQILPLFPENIRNFYDIFAGGANVAINSKCKGITIINDIESHVIELYKYIQKTDIKTINREIEKLIGLYNLSETKRNGYEYYSVNSSDGLKEVNKNQYEKLRADYNNGVFDKSKKTLVFYVLLVYAFNNQIRFNSSGFYNMPTGKRDFNEKMEVKLIYFKKALMERNVVFNNKDFRVILDDITNTEDFVYLDPPYLISTASYNENGGWSFKDEKDLLRKLDELNDRNVNFALSNVLIHKGMENTLLKEWAKRYNIHYLDYHYNNSNYQSTANGNKTIEILITNY